MKFAAYDSNSIYAIGDTPTEAVARARRDAKNDSAQFLTAPIRDGLADCIEEAGWNPHMESFALDETGFVIDTTDKT